MSKKQNGVLVTAPLFGTVKDTELVPCPKCGGTGKVKGIVTVDWVPDGEVKPCLKGNSNAI